MATFTLSITTDGAAFEGDDLAPEIARILARLADEVAVGPETAGWNTGNLFDVNGNNVGRWGWSE